MENSTHLGKLSLFRRYCLLMIVLITGGMAYASEYSRAEDDEPVAKIGSNTYLSLNDAVKAATAGQTVQIIAAGNYSLPGIPNITIEGTVEGVVFNHTGAGNIASIANGATFRNVTFNLGNNNYHGFQHAGAINMEGCTLNGKLFSYGKMVFTNCNFIQSNSDYHMWCYSGDLTYNNCTFTNQKTGKFLNIYNEDGATKYNIVVNGCKFINNGAKNKAAINVKATSGSNLLDYNVTINNCTAEGSFPDNSYSTALVVIDPVVQVDDRTSDGVDNITVYKDGVLVYPQYEAQIGEKQYAKLQLALDAAYSDLTGDVTVKLLKNISGYSVVRQKEGQNLIIDGSDFTVNGEIIVDGCGHITSETLTIKNIKFEDDGTHFHSGKKAFVLFAKMGGIASPYTANRLNDAHHVTIDNCSFTSTLSTLDIVGVTSESGAQINDINITNSTGTNLHSLAQLTGVTGGSVIGCTLTESESFVNVNGGKGEFNISQNNFTCKEGTDGYGVRENAASEAIITLADNDFTAANAIVLGKNDAVTKGNINVVSGSYTGGIFKTTAATGKILVSGGHFSQPVDQAYCADGYYSIPNLYVNETPDVPHGVTNGIVRVTQNGESTLYTSLQEAFNAAQDGAVVTPLIDIDATSTMYAGDSRFNLWISKSITLDGEGKTITVKGRGIGIKGADSKINVTIKDATIKNVGNANGRCVDTRGNLASLTLDNTTLTTAESTYTGFLQPLTIGGNQAEATNVKILNGSEIIAADDANKGYAITTFNPVNMTIDESTIKGWACFNLKAANSSAGSAGSVITITNSTLVSANGYSGVSNAYSLIKIEDDNVNVDITGSTINVNGENNTQSLVSFQKVDNSSCLNSLVTMRDGNDVTFEGDFYYSSSTGETSRLAISGGIFNKPVPEDDCADGYVPVTLEEGKYSVEIAHYVAQIGETKYVTLAAAVAAVPADGSETTIIMIDDETINSNAGVEIPSNKNVVLDLNGKTVKGVVQNPASAQTILNKGTLVVIDSSDEKNGTITNEVSDENAGSPMDKNWYSNAITNNGTLTVNAGNIVNTGTGGACYAIDNITNGTLYSPVLNIAGGNISAKKVAVRMFCNSTTNDNTVNITGGVVSSENAYAVQAQQANNSANKAKLNISGGTLSGQYAFVDYGNKNVATQFDNASYSITGGFFSGDMWSYATYYCGMDGFVSGGYFDNVVSGDLVVPGSACIDNTDEETKDVYPYTIGLADVHYYWLDNNGQIDGGGYYTIYAPFAGPDPVLMDGEFIELQKDVTLTKDIEYLEECSFGDPIFKGGTFTLTFGDYTINLNGFKFPLPIGVTVLTDKQTDIFSSLTEGYKVYEFKTATGYKYVCDHFEAECAGTYYKTFAEAAGVANGRVITLLDNISDTYAMSAGETLRVSKGGYSFNTPSAPESYSVKYAYEGATTVYTLTVAENFATINGYFRIKNNGNDKYVNVIGRRTATVNTEESEAESLAGTVIKVESNALGQVEVLRSQAVDIPHYAERAMSYVPDFVRLVVDKLHVDGSGEILGSTGVDAIMQKFNDNFDYHLYVENVEGGYRIFGRTPSMKPVVEFYYENKAKVDAKLPGLEAAVNAAIDKVVDRIGRGESLRGSFNLHKIWVAMGGTLTEPTDESSKVAFLQEVLTSETNVWNFGYQTVMQYVNKVENSSYFDKMPAELKKYWNLAKQAHPDFKYYIVQKDGGMDFISEGNIDIKENNARTIWTLEPVEDKFEVTIPENTVNKDGEYFTTLYTDFGYQLPSGVTALKVTGIDSEGVAQTEEIGSQVAAQTPVLLKTDASGTINITVGDFGSSVSGNLLHGADYVINEYDINNSKIEGLFNIFRESISYSIADDYEYLLRMNSGTVNNKYFFPIEVDGTLSDAYKAKTDNEMEETPIHYLGVTEDGKLAFIKSWEAIPSNGVYMFDEAIDPIYLDKPEHPADIAEGYYRIKNLGNNFYVNVLGRKTATVSTDAESAKTLPGTVLKVKASEGIVEILRSQAVDLPYYAQRAMSYVPDVVELVVSRLGVDGSGEILGSTGVQAILDKFNANFDYHLHVEYADEDEQNIRIYGKTPSMRPVLEFYKENKAKVDAKLPNLESEINEAIRKVVDKAGTGSVLLNSFKLETIWERMGGTLTKPVDDASKLTFLHEVLKNEKNIWNFAYQTATFYMEIVENKPEYFNQLPDEIRNYWNLAKQVRPNFKYYIVQKEGKMDFISEGNTDIINKNPRTMWNLEPLNENDNVFVVNIPEENSKILSGEYYTTIYTDFGYQLPEGVTALKVTEIKDVQGLGLAVTEEIGRDVAAQTPVLVKASKAGEIILTVGDYGTPVTGNLLHGADWLINGYDINTPALETLFNLFRDNISSSIADQYEYLLRKNSGTVNNKYFFSLSIEDDLSPAYAKKMNVLSMENSPVRVLGKNKNGKFLAFYETWDNLTPNAVYIFSEDYKPVFLYLIGDVDRDGDFDIDDVTAQVNIILGKDKPADNYDYEAADVEIDDDIDIDDVTNLVDVILGKKSLKKLILGE